MSDTSYTVPVTIGSTGRINTPPATLNNTLLTYVGAGRPDYTANLPQSLIEDVSSTSTGALVLMDQLVTDLINSVGPLSANPFILYQLGQAYGVQPGSTTNNSVYVTFSGSAGYIIPVGFTVSDGTYQYVVQDGGVIPTSGPSQPMYCVATQSGTWSVPAGTVTEVVTTVPSGYTVTCTNPLAGTPSAGTQTEEDYRAQVFLAGISPASAFASMAKSLLGQVPGVQPRLVSFQQQSPGWKAIVGGGDPYEVAAAIFNAGLDISNLVGSSTSARNLSVNLVNYPDTYSITLVMPPQQTVTINLTWNTTATNTVSASAVAQIGAPALQSYVNSVVVGQPMNLFELQSTFQQAIVSLIPTNLVTKMQFSVYINGSLVSPAAGTGIIAGDSESYFYCAGNGVSITQG